MRKLLTLFAAAMLAVGIGAQSSQAATIGVDTGWKLGSYVGATPVAFDFTLASAGIFSLTDCCATGDTYTVSGSFAAVSAPGTGGTAFPLGIGEFSAILDAAWFNVGLDFIQVALGAGSYSIEVVSDSGSGISTGDYGVRVDVSPVPVPAAGLLLLGAIAGLGAMSRRKKAA